jgi:membrane associated rhomboid family serine protease
MAVSEVAGFVTCVAIGQALLFGGKKPRLSSVLVGVICLLGIYLVYALTRDASLFEFHHRVLLIWLSIAIAGAISGYFAGVAIGLVFLVSHVTKQSLRRTRSR